MTRSPDHWEKQADPCPKRNRKSRCLYSPLETHSSKNPKRITALGKQLSLSQLFRTKYPSQDRNQDLLLHLVCAIQGVQAPLLGYFPQLIGSMVSPPYLHIPSSPTAVWVSTQSDHDNLSVSLVYLSISATPVAEISIALCCQTVMTSQIQVESC